MGFSGSSGRGGVGGDGDRGDCCGIKSFFIPPPSKIFCGLPPGAKDVFKSFSRGSTPCGKVWGFISGGLIRCGASLIGGGGGGTAILISGGFTAGKGFLSGGIGGIGGGGGVGGKRGLGGAGLGAIPIGCIINGSGFFISATGVVSFGSGGAGLSSAILGLVISMGGFVIPSLHEVPCIRFRDSLIGRKMRALTSDAISPAFASSMPIFCFMSEIKFDAGTKPKIISPVSSASLPIPSMLKFAFLPIL